MIAPVAEPALHGRRLAPVFGGLAVAMFLASLDQTVVATALPEIAGSVGRLDQLSWIIIAYHLAAAASTPLWGRASDLYGRKRLLLAAVIIFLAGSAFCGLARDLVQLTASRAVQGVGAGGMMTLSMAVIAEIVPARIRARVQGYLQLVFALAGVIGPLVGGLIVDVSSWRWIFYLNLPFGALAVTVLGSRLRLPARSTDRSLDVPGALLLVSGVAGLLLLTEQVGGAAARWWLLAGSAFLLTVFVWWERRTAEPILPPRLFRRPVFVVVTVALFLTTAVMFAVVIFVPLFQQTAAGVSATRSGLLLLPMTAGITVSTVLGGRFIARTGHYRWLPATGLALEAMSAFLLSRVTVGTSLLAVGACLVLFGLGFGMVTQVLVLALQNGADRRDLGIATASANLFRSLGGSVGAAVFGTIFAHQLNDHLARALPPGAALDADAVQSGPAAVRLLPAAIRGAVAGGIADAVDTVFLLATLVALAAFAVALTLRAEPLRDDR
ncbi:MDR family MFS transporter [Actinoplanes sp. NPDC051411]|uniref:MDR family MFS transporter n=1 Tax=Actinoplanes sp. NPDC051411 TaxID=3155522 RepID=UPI003413ACF6